MRNNPIYVMMPVKCFGKMCEKCPNLQLSVSVSQFSSGSDDWETKYETDIQCINTNRCLLISQMMEDEYDKCSE